MRGRGRALLYAEAMRRPVSPRSLDRKSSFTWRGLDEGAGATEGATGVESPR